MVCLLGRIDYCSKASLHASFVDVASSLLTDSDGAFLLLLLSLLLVVVVVLLALLNFPFLAGKPHEKQLLLPNSDGPVIIGKSKIV